MNKEQEMIFKLGAGSIGLIGLIGLTVLSPAVTITILLIAAGLFAMSKHEQHKVKMLQMKQEHDMKMLQQPIE